MKGLTLPVLCAALLTGGCAPTIGNKADVSTVTFEVGKTTKDSVANTLGLPADITRSAALGREFWAYRDQPELVSVMYAVPAGGGAVTTVTTPTGNTGDYEFADAAVVYVFDKHGVLIGVREPRHAQQGG